jgi:ribonucleoside-diphosphate reductase alpha chain
MAEPSGKKLDNLYKLAWVRGLKTTYYLRSLGATHMEKTGADAPGGAMASITSQYEGGDLLDGKNAGAEAPKACSILDPDCDACQ